MDDPGFSVKEVVPVTRGQKSLAKVVFTFDAEKNSANSARVPSATGWVLLDRDLYWVVREFDVKLKWGRVVRKDGILGGASKGTLDYGSTEKGFPLLKTATTSYQRTGSEKVLNFQYQFDLVEKDVPESDFTLSAFGFPEPGNKPFSVPWFAVALATGIVCVGSALWLQRRRQDGATDGT